MGGEEETDREGGWRERGGRGKERCVLLGVCGKGVYGIVRDCVWSGGLNAVRSGVGKWESWCVRAWVMVPTIGG